MQQSLFKQFQLFEVKMKNGNGKTIDDMKCLNCKLQKMVGAIDSHTWESFASEPLFVKNTFPISRAVNMLRISCARSWKQ